MNHYRPFCVATVILSMCLCIFGTQRTPSAKSKLSSAHQISMNIQESITIAAYDTAYVYFMVPAAIRDNDNPLRVSLSHSVGIGLTAQDSYGKEITLAKHDSYYLFPSSISTGERYFLCIANSLSQDQTLSLKVFYVEEHSPSPSPKISVSAQPKGAKDSKNSQSKKDPAKSTKSPHETKSSSGSSVNSQRKKSSSDSSMSSRGKKSSSDSSISSNSSEQTLIQTPIPDFHQEPVPRKSASTEKPISKSTQSEEKTDLSPTQPHPKKHFLRVTRGTSLALAEQIFDTVPTVPITMESSSEEISISNGIIYIQKEGLYYVTLKYADIHTTCTIKAD